ncbi:MAG: hypothetical protein MI799_22570 [Desulfobacterales bacterium]|nr:hypothetical protein [Desulfobacterales bacterium]
MENHSKRTAWPVIALDQFEGRHILYPHLAQSKMNCGQLLFHPKQVDPWFPAWLDAICPGTHTASKALALHIIIPGRFLDVCKTASIKLGLPISHHSLDVKSHRNCLKNSSKWFCKTR